MVFHDKDEILKCSIYRKHFDQIHHIIKWNGEKGVCRIKKKIVASYCSYARPA